MTDDKSVLKASVDSYTTGGTTAGHLGTSYAWYLLSPEWASIWPTASQPTAYNSGTATKGCDPDDGRPVQYRRWENVWRE